MTNPFKRLSDEELKDFKPLSNEEIKRLLEEGWEEAEKLRDKNCQTINHSIVFRG
jgi:hypothetical protein